GARGQSGINNFALSAVGMLRASLKGEFGNDGTVHAMCDIRDNTNWGSLVVILSAGIRPRDELARKAGVEIGPRGGVIVDNQLRTSDKQIFAIGEVALHGGIIYGLVAPGY